MTRATLKRVSASQAIQRRLSILRARFDELAARRGSAPEWRRLQYDAMTVLVEAQRELVALHGEILGVLRSDRSLYAALRVESLEAKLACDGIRAVIVEIDRRSSDLLN